MVRCGKIVREGVCETENEEQDVLDARNTIFCPNYDEAHAKVCNQPLGTLSQGERGKQVTTLEGVTVTSREDGGFFIHCPACGGGYFWHQSFAVPVEEVEKLLTVARLMGWQFIKFSGRKPKHVDSL